MSAGWMFFALGAVGWFVAIAVQAAETRVKGSDVQSAREALQQARARGTQALDPDTVLKAIEALVAALESLTKFGRPIQWALVSLVPLVMAAYLLKS
jgi:cobalamin biosynthesis protein CobD/CbiB